MREAGSIVIGQWVGCLSILLSFSGSEMLILGPSSHISSGHWGLFCALEKKPEVNLKKNINI